MTMQVDSPAASTSSQIVAADGAAPRETGPGISEAAADEAAAPSVVIEPLVDDSSPVSYAYRTLQRRMKIYETATTSKKRKLGSDIAPLYAIPQNNISVNALAIPACCSSLLSAGSDGYIRRYSWFPSIRRKGSNQQGPVLRGYWENPSIQSLENQNLVDISKARFGPASITGIVGSAIAVHSLVVQREEMFALAGSAEGVVNLFGVRIDEGQCRASLGLHGGNGHQRNKPVSALQLSPDERSLISGGWDAQLLNWDLDTGQRTRHFAGHTAHLCSVAHRPITTAMPLAGSELKIRDDAGDMAIVDADNNITLTTSSLPRTSQKLMATSIKAMTQSTLTTLPVPVALPAVQKPVVNSLKPMSDFSPHLFMSASIDGEAFVWDLRASNGVAQKLERPADTPPWAINACWSSSGDRVYVGRRNSCLDVFDLRSASRQRIRLPSGSGSLTALTPLTRTRQLLISSADTVRIWDESSAVDSKLPIVPTMTGGFTTLCADQTNRYLFAAGGGRSWLDNGREDIATFEIASDR